MGVIKSKKNEIKSNVKKMKQHDLEIYYEKSNYIKNHISFTNKDEIISNYNEMIKRNDLLENLYYQCKVYSKIANKDNYFNQQMLSIDKHINRLNKEMKNFSKDITNLQHKDDISTDFFERVSEKLINIKNFYQNIRYKIENIMKKYFGHLKIATANICMNKSTQELKDIYQRVNLYLKNFKNLNEAAEYIFFNSGQQIYRTIDSLIKALGDKYPISFHYFLETDDIIALELKEWIDLYNKFRFFIKKVNYVMDNQEFRKQYFDFETIYLILMMNMEISDSQIINYQI